MKNMMMAVMAAMVGTFCISAANMVPPNEVHWLSDNEGFDVVNIVGDSPPAELSMSFSGEWISRNHQEAKECKIDIYTHTDANPTLQFFYSATGTLTQDDFIDDSGWMTGTWSFTGRFYEDSDVMTMGTSNSYNYLYGKYLTFVPKVRFGDAPNDSWVEATPGTWGTTMDWAGSGGVK